MRYLKEQDYHVLVRDEIKNALLDDYTDAKLYRAEDMAISQIKSYLGGLYDTEVAFSSANRNDFLVMIVIDCALYHLYSSLAPHRIPKIREDRYQDALDWLKEVAKGNVRADLPKKTESSGESFIGITITSEYPNEDNRW